MGVKAFIQSNKVYLIATLLLFLFLLMSVTPIYVPNRIIKVEENGDFQLLLKYNEVFLHFCYDFSTIIFLFHLNKG